MPTTSNFGWTTPADTDYVKDGALAIRTLANGIDTSLVDLKGGTTGQILSKNSNTDLDYTWINNDQGDITNVGVTSPITGGGSSGSVTIGIQDGTTAQKGAVQLENSTSSTSTTTAAVPASVKSAYDLADAAIPKSLVDAKADIVTATADNTPARLAVGSNNTRLIAASGETTGLKWVADTQNTVIDAEGDLLVGDAADTLQRLAVGSNGNVLTVDTSVDGKLKWAAPSAGALTLIKTQTFGSAVTSIAVTDVFSSTYDNYLILISGGVMSGSKNLQLQLGSTTTGYYESSYYFGPTSGTFNSDPGNNVSAFRYVATGSTDSMSGQAYLIGPNLAKATAYTSNVMRAVNNRTYCVSWGTEDSNTQHTGFTLLVDGGGNVTGGTVKVYGYSNS